MALDFYEILQVGREAEPEGIHSAYRRLARKYHPDVNHAPDTHARMKAINEAYEVLRDPLTRADYDRKQSWALGSEAKYRHTLRDGPSWTGSVVWAATHSHVFLALALLVAVAWAVHMRPAAVGNDVLGRFSKPAEVLRTPALASGVPNEASSQAFEKENAAVNAAIRAGFATAIAIARDSGR